MLLQRLGVPALELPPVDAEVFEGRDIAGKAVLVHTGWDRHWRTDAYFENHPFLTEAAARMLVERGARLVGIDSHNIDDTRRRARPAWRTTRFTAFWSTTRADSSPSSRRSRRSEKLYVVSAFRRTLTVG